MLFDPVYWIVLGVGAVLSLWATARVKGTFTKYSRMQTRAGLSGADVARRILEDHGIYDVKVEPVHGTLTDHYDPRSKTLRLSEPVYHAHSMSALGVAAHEVGHAIQHAEKYAPLQFRSAWVPIANLGGGISFLVIIAALFMGGAATQMGEIVGWLGVGLFATTTIFTLITLPVEFDASKRALATLHHGGYMTLDEIDGAKKVLDAAALTYVAAFITSAMTLLYWVWSLGLFGGRDE